MWDGNTWKDLKISPDSPEVYTSVHRNLVFSLYVDWFNPFGNKHGGKLVSISLVLLVCMNLPPEERYWEENLYLFGIIPGPKEPSLDQMNHIPQPLVAEFQLFAKGVWFTSTALYPQGRKISALLCPLIADLFTSDAESCWIFISHIKIVLLLLYDHKG